MNTMISRYPVVFEGSNFVIVDIQDALPKHRNFPRGSYDIINPKTGRAAVVGHYVEVENRQIDTLYCHQTAGSVSQSGIEAVIATTNFVINDPAWTLVGNIWRWTGFGRGWPGCPYTFFLAFKNIQIRKKSVILRCWNNDWVTWHSGDNLNSISIVCQGYFYSRHIKCFKPKKGCPDGKPSSFQLDALHGFIHEYAIASLGIKNTNIRGHYDSPKPKLTCPGDVIENEIEEVKRADDFPGLFVDGGILDYKLNTWEERQAALILLGHNIGKGGKLKNGVDGDAGDLTRLAIEAQEEIFNLEPNGYWDDIFDYRIRLELRCNNFTNEDIQALIP